MDRLLTWLQRPIDLLLWLSLVAGFLMMAHVTVDVAGRYLLNRPLEGTTEIVAAYYMVAVAYCPWAFIASRDRHIVADAEDLARLGHHLALLGRVVVAVHEGLDLGQHVEGDPVGVDPRLRRLLPGDARPDAALRTRAAFLRGCRLDSGEVELLYEAPLYGGCPGPGP